MTLSYYLTAPPMRPWVGLYEFERTTAQMGQFDLSVGFFDWNDPDLLPKTKAFLYLARRQNRIPLMNLEPFVDQSPVRTTRGLLNDVFAGHYDQRLTALSAILAAEHSPVLLRFGHEMDKTEQYAWSFSDPKQYISLYQYVYAKLNGKAMPHVRWVWSPAGTAGVDRFWPGDAYVNLIGISVYASRAWTADHSLESFADIVERSLWLQRKYERPLLVAEAGVSGSAADQQRWVHDAVDAMAKFPDVCGFVYFHASQPRWMPLATGHENWQLKKDPLEWLLQHLPLPKRHGLTCVGA